MKTLAVDTSALVSLGHTDLVEEINWNYEVLISKGILDELRDISEEKDDDAEASKKWLDISSELEIIDIEREESAEDELFKISKDRGLDLFTDDIEAVKRFEDEIDCYFSVHLVYLLFKKDIISRERSLLSLEKMKTDRDWKQNIIAVTAKNLFE